MSTPLLALAFHLAGINPATPTEKEFLEEVSKFVELSQNLGAIRTYSDEERAEIHTWIAFSQKISQEDLQKLDSLLVKRSFLVGNRITAADILTFAAIHDQKLVELVLQLAHVARWFDHVQHSVYPNVVPVTPITHRAFVFPWLESSSSTPAPVAATETKPPAAPENKKADAPKKEEKVENKKADKKEKAEKAEKPAEKKKEEAPKAATEAKPEEAKPLSADGLDPSKLEIRVGQIVKCWNHPESDKLLCEEIDLNEGSIRTIASGLRNFYTAEQMQGRKVLVLANLKERPMAGFKSQVRRRSAFFSVKSNALTSSNLYREWFYVLLVKDILWLNC